MERVFPPQNQNKSSSLPNFFLKEQNRSLFINWTAGLLGGFVSITIFSPLDLARTRHILLATTPSYGIIKYKGLFHTLAQIYHDEGFRGLYRGYNTTAITIPVFHSLYFSIFYKTKSYLEQTNIGKEQTVLRDMLASLWTGFVCNTVTNPLWVVRTRIQSQYLHKETHPKYTGLVSGMRKMLREEGYKSLFKGLLASYLGLSHCIILFPLYENIKMRQKQHKEELSNTDILIASNIAKIIAMTITYPHLVLRARLQDCRTPLTSNNLNSQESHANKQIITISSMFKNILKKEGFKGLYSGLRIDLIRVLPANSTTFLVFEYVKKRLQESLPREEKI